MNLFQSLQKHCGAKQGARSFIHGKRKYNRTIDGVRHQRMIGYSVIHYRSPVMEDAKDVYYINVYSLRNRQNQVSCEVNDPSWSELIRSMEMLCNNVVNKSFYERN